MARGLNKVLIIGNLGRDPEMRYTPSGKPVTSFSVAVSRGWTTSAGERREATEWFNVVAWGTLAEVSNQFLRKGSRVYVEGRLQTRSWDDPDGQRHSRTEVVATEMVFLDSRPGSEPEDLGFDDEMGFEHSKRSHNTMVEEREGNGQPAAGGAPAGAPERGERRPWNREGRPGGGPRGRFQRRRVCAFCVDKVDTIDYKDVNTLRRFVSDQGQINSRRRTGTCARHQRLVTVAVKRARYLALLPYTAEHVRRYS